MDWTQIFQAFGALVFVLGLLFLTLWFIKKAQLTGLKLSLKKSSTSRIKILEHHRLDIKNSLYLISCDNVEYLLLLGDKSNLILNQNNDNRK